MGCLPESEGRGKLVGYPQTTGQEQSSVNGSTVKQSASEVAWTSCGQYVAIAAAYEAVYEITYHLSFQQFLLTTGLRLACMLLMPRRYWPALAVGESVPLIENAIFCAENFGTLWAILASVPTIVLWWPLLKPIRKRWSLFDGQGQIRMPVLIGATFGAALITAAITTATLIAALVHAPGRWPDISPVKYFFAYLLGGYLGALTLTPVILALHERFRSLRGQPVSFAAVWRSTLLRDMLCWVTPALSLLVWFVMTTPDESARQFVRLALLLPVFVLASRHGWHGCAMGGMAASFALAITATGPLDAEVFRIQMVLALVLSATLVVQARMPSFEHGIRV